MLDYFKSLRPTQILLSALIVSELVTALLVSLMSLLLHGTVRSDFLLTGSVAALVTALSVVWLVMRLHQAILQEEQTQNELLEEQIRQRKKIEQRLSEAKLACEEVFEAVPAMIWMLDRQHRVQHVNSSAQRFMGCGIELMQGKNEYDLFPEELAKRYYDSNERVMLAGEPRFGIVEQAPHLQSGNLRWYNTDKVPKRSPSGEIEGLTIQVTDITPLKIAEREVAQFRHIMEQVHDAVFILDASSLRFRYVNAVASDRLGYSREQLLTMTPMDIEIESPKLEEVIAKMEGLKEVSGSHTQFESILRHQQGHAFPVEMIIQYLQTKEVDPCFVAILRDTSERKEAEARLARSETQFRTLVESTKGILWRFDLKLDCFTYVSPQGEAILGYPRESWSGLDSWSEKIVEEDRQQAVQMCMLQTSQGMDHTLEYRMQATDGRQLWIQDVVTVVFGDEGKPVELVGIFLDVTEEKKVERALQDSERRLRLVGDVAYDLIYEWDVATSTLRWFGDIDGLLGYEKGSISQNLQSWLALIHADDMQVLADAVETHKTSTEAIHYEYRVKHHNGSYRYWNDKGLPILNDVGKPVRWVGVCTDVTERTLAEQALTEANQRFDTVLNSLDAVVYVADMETHELLYVNQATEALFGDVTGQICWDVLQEGQFGPCPFCTNDHLLDDSGNPSGVVEWEFENLRVGRWFTIRDEAIPWPDGRTVRLEIATDITHLKETQNALERAKEEAEAASLAKSEFLATMSHEIRTPMNAILGTGELLMETPLTPDQREHIHLFTSAGQSLLRIIDDILDISRIEAGRLELEFTPFSIQNLIRDAHGIVQHQVANKGLMLLHSFAPDLPNWLEGDPTRLRQILINFLGNAVKFTNHGSIGTVVRWRAGERDQLMLQISVVDTGVGIPADKQALIFHAFTQADTSVTRRYGGSGLGLAISQRLAGLMQGTISLSSEPEHGSAFTLEVPLTQAQNMTPDSESKEWLGKTVFCWHDHSVRHEEYEEVLRRLGLEVLGQEVLGQEGEKADLRSFYNAQVEAHNGTADLLFIHYEGEGIDAILYALAEIRGEQSTTRLPIILSGMMPSRDDVTRLTALGVECMLRPSDRNLFEQMVKDALVRSEQARMEESDQQKILQLLVVDDSEDNLQLIQAFLKSKRYRLTLARNGQEAVDLVTCQGATPFDLVLMDVQMPEMDGYSATRMIRDWEHEEGRTLLPIVALTAHALSDHRQMSLEAGCTGHLTKPIKKKQLVEAIDSFSPNIS
uniref:Sensory/regulatory protein RpfC n=1 Tax=Magnetococcus massalia (strain MO-1) TaxID=451514 RepID=A0A1S7LF51_MAGMO|nr:putative hybrid histidine kinase with PAS sensor domain and response regulator receiver domain [Candidatus Magnetococcus massalia]